MKVGDKVWLFDENRRVYAKDENGRGRGGPIWREHWVERYIIGENRLNWIVGFQQHIGATESWWLKNGDRIPKKGPVPFRFATEIETIDKRAWVNDNRYKISQAVDRVTDYDTLQRIDAILKEVK